MERGTFDIYVSSTKVSEVSDGASFGELALLYNSPRAATVAATTSAQLWQLDRRTFRHIIAHSSAQQLSECKAALRRVPLLEALSEAEIGKVAAAVQLVTFRTGETIIKKGTVGAVFYIIKEGTVRCTNVGAGKKEQEDITLAAVRDSLLFRYFRTMSGLTTLCLVSRESTSVSALCSLTNLAPPT